MLQRILVPKGGKEKVISLISLQDTSKPIATIFPDYSLGMVTSAELILQKQVPAGHGNVYMKLPSGDVSDRRTELVGVNLNLVSSFVPKVVDIPKDITDLISNYEEYLDKDKNGELQDDELNEANKVLTKIRQYFGSGSGI